MQVVRHGNRRLVNDDKRRSGGKGKTRSRMVSNRPQGRMEVYGAAASQLGKDVKWLMSVVNVEDKYLDTTSSAASSSSWQYVLCNAISQGVTPSTRIGQSIKCVGIELRYTILCATASTAFQTVRLMLFVDKQPNAANPGATDVYGAGVLLPRTVGYLDRFKVIHEITMAFSPISNNGIMTGSFIHKQDFHQEFNTGNAGTIADITRNSLFVGYYTDQGANQATVSFTCRYVYVDN
jgi:hypothetical protein